MKLRQVSKVASGSSMLVSGIFALATIRLTVESDSKLLVPAIVLAIATCLAGALVLARPRFGLAMAILTLVPQALSFATRNIAYAMNIWPSYRIELDASGCMSATCIFAHSLRWTPMAVLRTDANYASVGLGIDVVSSALIFLFAWVYAAQGRDAAHPKSILRRHGKTHGN